MNNATPASGRALLGLTNVQLRPRFEGCNINTWIGFKHVCYLLEEALIEAWRQAHLFPRALYEESALCFEIVSSDTRILHALHMDDLVDVEIRLTNPGQGPEASFTLTAFVIGIDHRIKAVVSKMNVVLRALDDADTTTLPDQLKTIVATRVHRGEPRIARQGPAPAQGISIGHGSAALAVATAAGVVAPGANCFAWKWRIPYFYCYYNERLRHSGYLRLMEETVDLFLEERGISIKKMVDTKRLIPVVPHASVSMVREAYMEETILTIFRIGKVFKGLTYEATMDCYVERDGAWHQCQSGTITHGYAEMVNRRDWKLVPFDQPTLAAIENHKS